MAKKLKQGQRYREGFTQTQILLKLCEKDRTPTSEILDHLKERFYIREQKNVRGHHLKILEKQKLIGRESAGRGHPDYWFVIPDIRVLKKLVDGLNDPDSRHMFMKSPYYIDMIPFLCGYFLDNLHAAGMPELTEDAAECLKLGLRCSESCLLFVLNKTPPELKNVLKGLEDFNKQRKKSVSYHVSEILKNPKSTSKTLNQLCTALKIPHQNAAAIKREMHPEILKSITENAINSMIGRQPTWKMLFYGMMNRDQAFYTFWWSPDDENSVIKCVLDSNNPFSLTP